ncbi:Cell division protein FtsH [hydrothermal vent metagenome]|uniref:Cell division protein FtsH n=1 Tax=hydrothermal vent metagenome TaxID=652676 RepID=A0A3B1A770_9ZZZZ
MSDSLMASNNGRALELEIEWLVQVIDTRIRLYFEQECDYGSIYQHEPPQLNSESQYGALVSEYAFEFDERLVLMTALVPHLRPQALDMLLINNGTTGRGYAEFGGRKGKVHGGFLPTCETAAFLIAADDLIKRAEVTCFFEDRHPFISHALLAIGDEGANEAQFSRSLGVSIETVNRCTIGVRHKPDFSNGFPAKRIESRLSWHDLVLAPEVMDEVANISEWIKHQNTIMDGWGLSRIIKPGYRALFYGPPGTGKSMTAALLGAETGLDVYRIDLSQVVSKYIGETEKNLANVFNQAERKSWILFFDEADALFGKRTQTASSNDRYANQEVAYLLQRIEDFAGIVILATNLKANIDNAFARRFQSLVHFSMPDVDERGRLWRAALNGKCKTNKDVCFQQLAEKYELSGGAIINVIRYGALSALRRDCDTINNSDLLAGITKELRKEGKTL